MVCGEVRLNFSLAPGPLSMLFSFWEVCVVDSLSFLFQICDQVVVRRNHRAGIGIMMQKLFGAMSGNNEERPPTENGGLLLPSEQKIEGDLHQLLSS